MVSDSSQAAKGLDDLARLGRVNYQQDRTLSARLAPRNSLAAALGAVLQVNVQLPVSHPHLECFAQLWDTQWY
jgi:hypothetical protein